MALQEDDVPPASCRRPIGRDDRERALTEYEGRWSPGVVAYGLSLDAAVCSTVEAWAVLLDDVAASADAAVRRHSRHR